MELRRINGSLCDALDGFSAVIFGIGSIADLVDYLLYHLESLKDSMMVENKLGSNFKLKLDFLLVI